MSINEWRDAPRKLPQHLRLISPRTSSGPWLRWAVAKLGRDNPVYWGITIDQAQRCKQVRAETDAKESR